MSAARGPIVATNAPPPPSPMNMLHQSRPRQVSPLSIENSENPSFLSRYGNMTPVDSPYSAHSSNSAASMRNPGHHSPPRSQHQSASTDTTFSQRTSSRSPTGSQTGHYSSNSSVAPSSNGLDSPVFSESGRPFGPRQEETLQEHHAVLRVFLASDIARDGGARTARAKDKLIRLSPTQYLELSTDVYDEFRRREDDRRRRGQGVPQHLPPRNDFHPKRNQARQKLSHLSPDRFKQLATDAFFELERRLPRLAGDSLDRRTSPAGSVLNPQNVHYRAATPSSMRGPHSTLPPGVYRGPGPRSASSASSDQNRSMPQTFQTGNIVPNKGTMVEDDDPTYDDRSPGLRVNTRLGPMSSRGSPLSSLPTGAFPPGTGDLQEKLALLEEHLRAKTAEVDKMVAAKAAQEGAVERERREWDAARRDLEQQLQREQQSRKDAEQARVKMHEHHMESQAELRDQMDTNVSTLQAQIEDLTRQNESLLSGPQTQATSPLDTEWRDRCEQLHARLAEQQQVTEQVRRDAAQFLQEMRALSDQSVINGEGEERLQTRISDLQDEVGRWKDKYAKARTLLRTMKASSVGLSLENAITSGALSRPDFLSPDGAVRDVEVTNFQMSIDELLVSARRSSADVTLDRMKGIIQLVQHMTADPGKSPATITSAGPPSPASSPRTPGSGDPRTTSARLRAAKAASNLISTTRTFVSAKGLAPVSLVDAAAANLTAAVIDYVKLAGIRASPAEELDATGDHDPRARDSGLAASVPSVSVRVPESEPGPETDHAGLPESRSDSEAPSRAQSPPIEASAIRGPGGWFDRLKGSYGSNYSNENPLVAPHDDDF